MLFDALAALGHRDMKPPRRLDAPADCFSTPLSATRVSTRAAAGSSTITSAYVDADVIYGLVYRYGAAGCRGIWC